MATAACAKSSVTMLRLWLLLACIVSSTPFLLNCPPCEYVPCPPLPESCSNSSVYYDECGCCLLCGIAAGERCGGETSEAECVRGLRCAYRLGDILGEERTGVCEHELCANHVCGYRQRCRVRYTQIDCLCPNYKCEGRSNPVCGYDGNTYPSVCHLQKTECLNNKFIGIRHPGTCPVTGPSHTEGGGKRCLVKVINERGVTGWGRGQTVTLLSFSTDCVPPSTATVCAAVLEPPPPLTRALKTNAVPTLSSEDDEFFQAFAPTQETEAPVPRGCLYRNTLYEPNQLTQADRFDLCRYLFCNSEGILEVVFVPGCRSGPPEPDYHVEKRVVHGGWTDWSNWTDCTGSGCYSSFHSRFHSCTKPRPQHEGRDCEGEKTETAACIPIPCQSNHTCEFSEWSDWSDCSKTCGAGTTVRTRELLNDIPGVPDEELCVTQEEKRCRLRKCPKPCKAKTRYEFLVDADDCVSNKRYLNKYCGGDCEEGWCCQPSEFYEAFYPVDCPGKESLRDSYFKTITECECQPCELLSGDDGSTS